MGKMNWRKIVVQNKTYLYHIGGWNIVIKSEDGKKLADTNMSEVTGRTPDVLERGAWKKTSDGMVTPKHISNYIEQQILGLPKMIELNWIQIDPEKNGFHVKIFHSEGILTADFTEMKHVASFLKQLPMRVENISEWYEIEGKIKKRIPKKNLRGSANRVRMERNDPKNAEINFADAKRLMDEAIAAAFAIPKKFLVNDPIEKTKQELEVVRESFGIKMWGKKEWESQKKILKRAECSAQKSRKE